MSHLFVVHGDLMSLACDAWCVPGGYGPGGTWKRALPARRKRLDPPPTYGAPGHPRAFLLAEVEDSEPLPFLTDIVADDRHGPDWWVQGARDFVRVAAATLAERGRKPIHGRERHLVALPLVGTGGGGASHLSGDLVRLLLGALREEASAAGVDVALVLYAGPAWAAAQHERQQDLTSWADLPDPLILAADRLAARARAGDLVLFLGAGVSQAAGLPGWAELLAEIAQIDDPEEQEALMRLGELDRAAIIEGRLRSREAIGTAVARLIVERSHRHGLSHALLASLPVDEIVTTNYDELFERASENIRRPCAILPGRAVGRGDRWILKMHGGVDRPDTIVLTREDYLKFQENRTALAGIVQTLLLTRHMLFVGFSLTDDNFHRIAHAVRKALGERQAFGTTLVVNPNPLARELWSGDLEWVPFDRDAPGTPGRSFASQARLVEIFLDRLSCQAATATPHLGDWKYDGALSPGERALRDRLVELVSAAGPEEKLTAAWSEVSRMLSRLGISH